MGSVFQKLNLKDQREILVLNAPGSFEPELRQLADVSVQRRMPRSGPVGFALVFATEQAEVDAAAARLAQLAPGDAVVWFAYPKGTSKRYKCNFNRDTGWKALGKEGFEPVRMVAIDEDWSALRFRRAEFIKAMTRGREHALSKQGRKKAAPGAARRRRSG
jgi:hypothetical protein